jgi:hypothetical protein
MEINQVDSNIGNLSVYNFLFFSKKTVCLTINSIKIDRLKLNNVNLKL